MSSSFQKSFCAKTPFKQVDEGSKELDAMEAGASKNAVEPVVVEAPKNYSQIKNRDGSQLMTASEAKELDETGFMPSSVKDKEFRGAAPQMQDEDSHEFDHKPAESEIKKADYINAKMAKMKKERQGRKAVKDVNKVITSIKNLNI
jgi:hypothetical protein